MSVKLYRNNESGEIVAATLGRKDAFGKIRDYQVLTEYDTKCTDTCIKLVQVELFEKKYTALPEAPEVGSTAWAVWMLNSGEKLENPTEAHGDYIYKVMDEVCFADGWVFRDFQNYLFKPNHTWRLYSPPKPIVECLPHEFVKRQKVLMRNTKITRWVKTIFDEYHHGDEQPWGDTIGVVFRYCIPYAGNEHIEGQITDGEHGAVPRGYVPPHVPQLGDDDYFEIGDEIIDLSNLKIYTIHNSTKDGLWFFGKDSLGYTIKFNKYGELDFSRIRIVWHVGSGVNTDGTVNENIPTRPHKIIDTDTYGE